MDALYDLKNKLCRELEEYGDKDLSAGSLSTIDLLAHTIKNLDKIIDSYGYSETGRAYDGMYDGSYDGRSYARGRMNARRDSRGRYSSRGYSMDNTSMVHELRELMNEAPDDRTRQEFQRFISKMEQM